MGTKLRLIGSLGKAVLAGCLHRKRIHEYFNGGQTFLSYLCDRKLQGLAAPIAGIFLSYLCDRKPVAVGYMGSKIFLSYLCDRKHSFQLF